MEATALPLKIRQWSLFLFLFFNFTTVYAACFASEFESPGPFYFSYAYTTQIQVFIRLTYLNCPFFFGSCAGFGIISGLMGSII